jgi:hypothetical protein
VSIVPIRHNSILGSGLLGGLVRGVSLPDYDGIVLHSDTNAAEKGSGKAGRGWNLHVLKPNKVKDSLREQTRKFLANWTSLQGQLLEATMGMDKPQTLELRKPKLPSVNQGANIKQLTLFNLG